MLAAPAFFNTPGQSQRGDEQPPPSPPHGDGALSMAIGQKRRVRVGKSWRG